MASPWIKAQLLKSGMFTATVVSRVFAAGSIALDRLAAGGSMPAGTWDFGAGPVKTNDLRGSTPTTANFKIVLVDNLADALNVQEGANSYLKFITTDGAEAIVIGKAITAPPGGSTAAAGTTTADAGVLPAGTSSVYPTTGADDIKGVRVNAADKVTGREICIGNGVSNKILKVYAPSGGTINGAAADAAFSSASGKGVWMYCLDSAANTWLAS